MLLEGAGVAAGRARSALRISMPSSGSLGDGGGETTLGAGVADRCESGTAGMMVVVAAGVGAGVATGIAGTGVLTTASAGLAETDGCSTDGAGSSAFGSETGAASAAGALCPT